MSVVALVERRGEVGGEEDAVQVDVGVRAVQGMPVSSRRRVQRRGEHL